MKEKLQFILLALGLIVGGGAWWFFGSLNAVTAKTVVPVGKFQQMRVIQTASSGTAVGWTSAGPAVGVIASGSDQAIIETDKGAYRVAGFIAARQGDDIELRTMVNHAKKLCVRGTQPSSCVNLAN